MLNKWIILIVVVLTGLFVWSLETKTIKSSIEIPTVFPSPIPHVFSEETLFELVQEWRITNNLPTYTKSDVVCNIAEQRLIETKQNWEHTGFEAKRFCTFENCEFAENLARDYQYEQDVLDSWLKSASHSASLKANYYYSCIASDGDYVVHIFGNMW